MSTMDYRHFLSGMLGASLGYERGKAAAQQHNEEQDDHDLAQAYQMYQSQTADIERRNQQRVAEQGRLFQQLQTLNPQHPVYADLQRRYQENLGQKDETGPDFSHFIQQFPRAARAAKRRGLNFAALAPQATNDLVQYGAPNTTPRYLPDDPNKPAESVPLLLPKGATQGDDDAYEAAITGLRRAIASEPDEERRAQLQQAGGALLAARQAGKPIASAGYGPMGMDLLAPRAVDPKQVTAAQRRVATATEQLTKLAQQLPDETPQKLEITNHLQTAPVKIETPEELAAAEQYVRNAGVLSAFAGKSVAGQADREKREADLQFDRITELRKQLTQKNQPPGYYASIAAQIERIAQDPQVRKHHGANLADLIPTELNPTPQTVRRQVPIESVPLPKTSLTAGERGYDALTGKSAFAQQTAAPSSRTDYQEQEVKESPAEAKARVLLAAAKYADDPKLRMQAFHNLATFTRQTLPRLSGPESAAQRASLIHSLNDAAEAAGVGQLPDDITLGLTPGERAVSDERMNRRAMAGEGLRLRQIALNQREQLLGIQQRAQDLAESRFDFIQSKATAQKAQKALSSPATQALLSDYRATTAALNKEFSPGGRFDPDAINDFPEEVAQAARRRQELTAKLNDLRQRINTASGSEILPQLREDGTVKPVSTSAGTAAPAAAPTVATPGPAKKAPPKTPQEARQRFINRLLTNTNRATGQPYTAQEAEHAANQIDWQAQGR